MKNLYKLLGLFIVFTVSIHALNLSTLAQDWAQNPSIYYSAIQNLLAATSPKNVVSSASPYWDVSYLYPKLAKARDSFFLPAERSIGSAVRTVIHTIPTIADYIGSTYTSRLSPELRSALLAAALSGGAYYGWRNRQAIWNYLSGLPYNVAAWPFRRISSALGYGATPTQPQAQP